MRCLAVSCALLASACGPASRSATLPPAPGATVEQPAYTGPKKLVVLLVIDQWPQWAFQQKAPALTAGFDRILREGQWLTGTLPTPATHTAPGHALLGTGEPPYRSGILANEWWDVASNAKVQAAKVGDAISVERLRVPGLGDAVASAGTGAKAVGVALKARAALLMLGRSGTAIWYDDAAVGFVSSQPVAWLPAFNRERPASAHLRVTWTPLDPARLATLSGTVDAQRGELGDEGFGTTFPYAAATTERPARAITAMPLANDLVLDAARAAITGEQLGTDATPDLLAVSLSAHDIIHHAWGHESWESWDMTLRLDTSLADFLAFLDTHVGKGEWAMIVTSDHGAAPLPERTGGGRMRQPSLAVAANNAAATELGTGTWVVGAKNPYIWLTPAFHKKPNPARSKALEKMLRALRSFPGIELADRTATFAGDCDKRTGRDAGICKMIDPERAGEIVFLARRHWIFEEPDAPLATAHGSWHDYDRQVPVILLPFGRTPHARPAGPAGTLELARVSTLIATWLGVTPPRELPRK